MCVSVFLPYNELATRPRCFQDLFCFFECQLGGAVLTVRALLAAGLEQQLGDGRVVGHDGDVERRQALAVGRVEVQLVGAELVEQDLHGVQVLLLHRLEDAVAALHRLRGKQAHTTEQT